MRGVNPTVACARVSDTGTGEVRRGDEYLPGIIGAHGGWTELEVDEWGDGRGRVGALVTSRYRKGTVRMTVQHERRSAVRYLAHKKQALAPTYTRRRFPPESIGHKVLFTHP